MKHQFSKITLIGLAVVAVGLLVVYFISWKSRSQTTNVASNSGYNYATSPQAKASATATPTATTATTAKISILEPGKIILSGGYADPTIAKTATGYRMYVNRQSGGPSGYMSFTSTDGQTWTKEKDSIISGAATGRAVVLPIGVRFYYPGPQPIKASDGQADLLSAFSTDGVTFKKDSAKVLSPKDSAHYVEGPTVFQLPDQTWRLYFNENSVAAGNQRDGIIYGASSKDGISWTRDEAASLTMDATESGTNAPWSQVLHPFVIKNPQGGYLMFYNSHSEIYVATSTDGLKWTKTGKVGIRGADLDGYFQADGTLRVFYGDFSEATQGVVYMAVLKV